MNLSLKGLYLGLAALMSVLLFSGLLGYRHLSQLRTDTSWVTHTYAVLEALGDTLASLNAAEAGQRGFLVTGDPGFLETSRGASARSREQIQRLLELVQDRPAQAARVRELARLCESSLAVLEATAARQSQDPAAVRLLVQGHLEHDPIAPIQAQVAAIGQEEHILLAQRQQRSRRSYLLAVRSGAALALLGLAMAAGILVQLRRHFRERARFELTLAQSESRFRKLTQLSPNAIWVNRDDRVELPNDQALRLLGLSSPEQLEGRSPYDLFHPDCHGTVRERLRQVRSGAVVQGSEEALLRADGHLLQVEVSAAAFEDAKGPAIQVVVRDVSERQRRDEELKKVHRALRAVSNSSQALIRSETAETSEFLREICQIISQDCGYPMVWIALKEEDPARTIRPVAAIGFEPGFLEEMKASWSDDAFGQGVTPRALRTGKPCLIRDTWSDPTLAPWRPQTLALGARSALALPLLEAGRAFGAVTLYSPKVDVFSPGEVALLEELAADLAHGITTSRLRQAQVSAQAALRESEERFRTAFETAAVPMSLSWPDGRVIRVNAAYCELFGYTKAELETDNFMNFTHPDDRAATQAGVARLARGELTSFRLEKRYLRKDGTLVWGDMSSAWVPDALGRPSYLVTHIQDISERKRAESQLLEASRRKDEFLATLAHELRNPLAPIRTGAFLLTQRGAPDPETAHIHELIATQSAHMARLVDDLLDMARIEGGKVELRKERVDPGRALAGAVEVCRPLIRARNQQVTLAVPGALPALEADPVRLEQMLCNLLNNACKYSPPGARIEAWAAAEAGQVVLGVRDAGVGMSPEVLARAFDLFYQAGQSRDRPEGGLGLGLTLVRTLAELHGGSVSAASAGPGRGSEFLLRLPALAEPPAALAAEPAPAAAPAARQKHVLIIDDDRDVRATSEMLLRRLDFQVTTAATGLAGIERAKALRPDIALIDLGMPGLDGLEVGARIRAALGPDIYLVALTGYSRESDLADTRAAGFDRHLVKSGDPRELIQALKSAP